MMGGVFGQGKGFRNETGKGVVPISGTVRNKEALRTMARKSTSIRNAEGNKKRTQGGISNSPVHETEQSETSGK
jgi:hypothetical protein